MNQAFFNMADTYPSRSLHGSIVHELGKRIVSGVYPVGSTLPVEAVLREELDVSRNALREAVKVLSAKGLLVVKTRTGTQVQPQESWRLTDPDVLAWSLCGEVESDFFNWLHEFRSIIEPAVASLAAKNASKAERVAIQEKLEALEVAYMDPAGKGSQSHVNADMAFHEAIFLAAGNPFFKSVSSHMGTALAKSRKVTHEVQGAQERSLPLHRQVAEAIISGRREEAKAAMESLLKLVEGDLREALQIGK